MACEVPRSAMADSEPMLGSAWSVRFEDMDFRLRFGADDFFFADEDVDDRYRQTSSRADWAQAASRW